MIPIRTAAIAKRFALHVPKELALAAYVIGGSEAVDLDKYVGKSVAVYGMAVRYDRETNLRIVEVEKVGVLDEQGMIVLPPSPLVRPRPTTQPAEEMADSTEAG